MKTKNKIETDKKGKWEKKKKRDQFTTIMYYTAP